MNNNWIFLRGLTRGNIHWGNFPEIFLKINPDAKVEFLEIPGNGLLNNELTPTDPKLVIDLIRAKSSFCQNNLPFHLCGISLGGMIALKWAELYPQNIENLVIINSSLKQFSPFYHRLNPRNYGQIFLALLETSKIKQETIILKITSNKFNDNEIYLKTFSEFATNNKFLKENLIRQLFLANNIKIGNLSAIKIKIISSKNDRLVDFSCSNRIASNFGIKQIIHPTAGHDLPLDEPEWLARHLNF